MFNKNRVKKLEEAVQDLKMEFRYNKEQQKETYRDIDFLIKKIAEVDGRLETFLRETKEESEESKILKVRKKSSLVFEAIQWTGNNPKEVVHFCGSNAIWHMHINDISIYKENRFYSSVPIGNWIVKDEQGKCYSWSSDSFESAFEEV